MLPSMVIQYTNTTLSMGHRNYTSTWNNICLNSILKVFLKHFKTFSSSHNINLLETIWCTYDCERTHTFTEWKHCINFIEMKIGRINEILIDLGDIDFNFKTIELKWSLSWIWKIYTTANTLFNSKGNFRAFRMHDVTILFKEHNSNLMNMVFGYQCCMPLICSFSSIFKAVKFVRARRYQLPTNGT